MKAATLLILVLAHHGLWFGGVENRITVRWAVPAGLPEAIVEWELSFAGVRIADGKAAMPANGEGAVLTMKLPEVRAHTVMHWTCHVRRRDDGRELADQDAAIGVFPRVTFADLVKRYEKQQLLLIDRPEGIVRILEDAGVPHTATNVRSALMGIAQDVIIVGVDQLDESPFLADALMSQAEGGASVLVLRQSRSPALKFPIGERNAPNSYVLDADHPLLADLAPAEWQAALEAPREGVRAIQLPPDAPALAVVSFPQDVLSSEPTPIDALLVVQSVGKGRIVLCQLPLDDFEHDPAARIFLNNALDYLLTRPQPTPPPSQRTPKPAKVERAVPEILLDGDKKP